MFYILDICAVSATKLTRESLSKNLHKSSLIKKLNSIDKSENNISYYAALLEKVSDKRGKLTKDELKKQIIDDRRALRTLFKYASVYEPEEFLIKAVDEMFQEPVELLSDDYITFLNQLNNELKLYNPVSEQGRLSKVRKIINIAESLGIKRQHNIVAIALACIYDNHDAKKVIKFKKDPKKFSSVNAYADIAGISRIAKALADLQKIDRNRQVEFLTDDKALSNLVASFRISSVTDTKNDEIVTTKFRFDVQLNTLLKNASEADYDVIYNLLSEQKA